MKAIVIVRSINEFTGKLYVRNGKVIDPGESKEINPWDLYAIEAAVQFKEKYGGEIIALSIGSQQSMESLKRALALGCDRAIFISCSNDYFYDSSLAAHIIKNVIEFIGAPDIIFGGYIYADVNDSTILAQAARLLNYGYISLVTKLISIDEPNQTISIGRRLDKIREIIQTKIPIVLTIDKEFGEPRYPSFLALQRASKLPINEYCLDDLGVTYPQNKIEYLDVRNYEWNRTQCELINGSTPELIAQKLIDELSSKGII